MRRMNYLGPIQLKLTAEKVVNIEYHYSQLNKEDVLVIHYNCDGQEFARAIVLDQEEPIVTPKKPWWKFWR